MKTKKCFLAFIVIGLIASGIPLFGQYNELDLIATRGNTRQIVMLDYDRENSSLETKQAVHVMDGFFNGISSHGKYRIKLSRESLDNLTSLEVAMRMAEAIAGGIVRERFRFTACIQILDMQGNIIAEKSKSDVATIVSHFFAVISSIENGGTPKSEVRKMSKVYSSLIGQCRDEINREAALINERLKPAHPPIEIAVGKLFNGLSSNLDNGTCIAILHIASPDYLFSEKSKILNYLTTHFVNSNKYIVVERNNLELVLREQGIQGNKAINQETAVKIGELVGARVLIYGELISRGNEKDVTIFAVSVETGRFLGAASETF